MIPLDVAVEYAPLATQPFVVNEAEPVGEPVRGGLVIDVGLARVASGALVLSPGVRAWGARWDREIPFTSTVWNADLDFGYRFQPEPDAFVSGFWLLGGGLRAGLLAVDRWEDIFTWGVGGATGGGVVIGQGPVRALLSLRASVTLDVDRWDGVVQAHETTTWSYWPGNARIAASAGAAFR